MSLLSWWSILLIKMSPTKMSLYLFIAKKIFISSEMNLIFH